MRINVNLPLTGNSRKVARFINKHVTSEVGSKIDFSDGFTYPHINENDVEFIAKNVELISKKERLGKFAFTGVYRPEDTSKYLFMRLENPEEIVSLKRKIYDLVSHKISPLKHGGVPHVTIAYLDSIEKHIEIEAFNAIDWKPEYIAISMVGDNGTCIDDIFRCKIG